jgi:site-specific DNA-methyltransferase (adenine-specific)
MLLTTQEGDTCLDPYLGSGTSAVVAQSNNRNFIGIEIDEKYMNLTKENLKNFTQE